MDDATGASCCEPPNVGYTTAAKAGNQEAHEPGAPKLSAWPIPHPGCVLTAVKEQEQWVLGEEKKKQKHKREGGKGM